MGGERNRTSYEIARIMNSKADGVYGGSCLTAHGLMVGLPTTDLTFALAMR